MKGVSEVGVVRDCCVNGVSKVGIVRDCCVEGVSKWVWFEIAV